MSASLPCISTLVHLSDVICFTALLVFLWDLYHLVKLEYLITAARLLLKRLTSIMNTGLVAQKFSISNRETGSLANRRGAKPESYKPSFAGGLLYSLLTSGTWLRNHADVTLDSHQPSAECKLLHGPASDPGSLAWLPDIHIHIYCSWIYVRLPGSYIFSGSKKLLLDISASWCPPHLRIMLHPFLSWKCNSILFPLWYFLQE